MTYIMRALLLTTCGLLVGLIAMPDLHAARIKDIAYVQGVRDNQLLGYGLVVGLDGTGDYGRSEFTVQSTASMLSRMGIKVDKDRIQTRNVAAVMVTADLPPFARSGQRLDIIVSSLGNARSLQGGTLLMTPLMGPDGSVYAVGQGALSIGGYNVSGGSGNFHTKNHVNVGRIPNGAIVERTVPMELNNREYIRLILHDGDFRTAVNISNVINDAFPSPSPEEAQAQVQAQQDNQQDSADPNANQDTGALSDDDTDNDEQTPTADQSADQDGDTPQQVAQQDEPVDTPTNTNTAPQTDEASFNLPGTGIAKTIDSATISVDIPEPFREHVPQFIAFIEMLEVERDTVARVIINERTGTVVLGGNVRISEVAVAHGNLHVRVSTEFEASQPSPFQVEGAGETVVVPDTDIEIEEDRTALTSVPAGSTIGDVVAALNAIGATPRDLIAILQAIKSAGALHAQLEIQ